MHALPCTSRCRQSKGVRLGGFTAIELVVTIGIIVVILSAMVPLFSNMLRARKLEGSIFGVEAGLRSTRSLAINKHQYAYFLVRQDDRFEYGLMSPLTADYTVGNATILVASTFAFPPMGPAWAYKYNGSLFSPFLYNSNNGSVITLDPTDWPEDDLQTEQANLAVSDYILFREGQEILQGEQVRFYFDAPTDMPFFIVFRNDGSVVVPGGGMNIDVRIRMAPKRVENPADEDYEYAKITLNQITGRSTLSYE